MSSPQQASEEPMLGREIVSHSPEVDPEKRGHFGSKRTAHLEPTTGEHQVKWAWTDVLEPLH